MKNQRVWAREEKCASVSEEEWGHRRWGKRERLIWNQTDVSDACNSLSWELNRKFLGFLFRRRRQYLRPFSFLLLQMGGPQLLTSSHQYILWDTNLTIKHYRLLDYNPKYHREIWMTSVGFLQTFYVSETQNHLKYYFPKTIP